MDAKQAEAEARRIILSLTNAEIKRLKELNQEALSEDYKQIIKAMERVVTSELYDQAHNAHILAYYVSRK